jgi:hypothetical protein
MTEMIVQSIDQMECRCDARKIFYDCLEIRLFLTWMKIYLYWTEKWKNNSLLQKSFKNQKSNKYKNRKDSMNFCSKSVEQILCTFIVLKSILNSIYSSMSIKKSFKFGKQVLELVLFWNQNLYYFVCLWRHQLFKYITVYDL